LGEDWEQLSPAEKRERWFQSFLDTAGIDFTDPEAEAAYKVRAQRMIDVYQVREPDRVPVRLPIGTIPLRLAGISIHTAMYDYQKLITAYDKFYDEYELDTYTSAMVPNGHAYDLLECKIHRWPGHGLPVDSNSAFQFVEGEYMKAGEYDDLIDNPSDFWMRVFLPRILGIWEPFAKLSPLTDIIEHPEIYFTQFADLELQNALQKIIDVGQVLVESGKAKRQFAKRGRERGFPMGRGGMGGAFAKAPFDTLGDTLRGTHGIMMDMYRQPDKLLEASDIIAKLTIKSIVASANATKSMIALFPLHKGADGWMSQKQFETFYWPSLKKVIDALISEGIMVSLFAEGSYNSRLDSVNEFPKGMVHWIFDQTDIIRAKAILGERCSISGNVPASLLVAGTPSEVKEYCRQLIEACGSGGGYILAAGNNDVPNASLENIIAMDEAVKEYGYYRK
jgi:hypothetical protein